MELTEIVSVNLNKKVVIDNDILTIIDYFIFNQNYFLSNDTRISFDMFTDSTLVAK